MGLDPSPPPLCHIWSISYLSSSSWPDAFVILWWTPLKNLFYVSFMFDQTPPYGTYTIHCNTLQHTTIHCTTSQHTATHYITRHHAVTHCNTLQHATNLSICDIHNAYATWIPSRDTTYSILYAASHQNESCHIWISHVTRKWRMTRPLHWRVAKTPTGCKLQVIFRKRALNDRALCGKWHKKIRHPMGLRHSVVCCDAQKPLPPPSQAPPPPRSPRHFLLDFFSRRHPSCVILCRFFLRDAA